MLEILILPLQILFALVVADAFRTWNVHRQWKERLDYYDEESDD